MSSPFLGEIKMFGGNFAPQGWAMCNGQFLPIAQNQALFSLFGTTYGGNGVTTFALPDFRGRVPIHVGQGPGLSPYVMGQASGQENVTLTQNQMPTHTHPPSALSSPGTVPSPSNALWAAGQPQYSSAPPNAPMNPGAVQTVGGSQPHNNMPPYLGLTFVVAIQGIFPSRN